MKISILTLFPDMFSGPFSQSIIKRAIDKNLLSIEFINIRTFATDKYKTVDGHPYGGGVGMILRVDVVDRAFKSVGNGHKILLDARGAPYTQKKARAFSKLDHLILLCGHYEGVDARVKTLVDEEISIGEYVLTGGEIPAMVIADSVARLVPGVLKTEATADESYGQPHIVEYPQYTQPRRWSGMNVPDVLLGGNHAAIAAWKKLRRKRI